MALQKLLLPKTVFALIAVERLLVRVNQHMRFEMTLRNRRVRAKIAFEALFPFVRLLMNLEGVAIGKRLSTHFAMHRLIRSV